MLLHAQFSFFDPEFTDFLKLGWDHIIDIKAYDHLLFVMVLCALFNYKEWRKVLVVVTAFTIGHSLTLALSALDLLLISQELIEVLIPLTILITALSNIVTPSRNLTEKTFDKPIIVNYAIALFFGLIHGLGFANNFKFMLGEETSIIKQLFAFNTGLELGQITVVILFMVLMYLFSKTFKLIHREWTLFLSGAGAGLALMMIINVLIK